jgi:hypothetical protein
MASVAWAWVLVQELRAGRFFARREPGFVEGDSRDEQGAAAAAEQAPSGGACVLREPRCRAQDERRFEAVRGAGGQLQAAIHGHAGVVRARHHAGVECERPAIEWLERDVFADFAERGSER